MPTQFPIIVIADDLSGAAELAGLAAARGLTTEIQRELDRDISTTAEVLAIDTSSRNFSADRAWKEMLVTTVWISGIRPARVYKKTDSVLRGRVRAEIEALLEAWHLRRAILIPANPTRGRTIVGGTYLIDGIPLDQTFFADDPEFPRRTSRPELLLDSSGNKQIHVVGTEKRLPPRGIIIPDAASFDDLLRRANKIDSLTLPVGAADFFEAMLDKWCGSAAGENPPASSPINLPALLVCGSYAAWQTRKNECAAANVPFNEAAAPTFGTANWIDYFATVSDILQTKRCLVLATGQTLIPPHEQSTRLQNLAHAAAFIVRQNKPATLLLEGGATAAAVVTELGWKRFSVKPSTTKGVGFLKPFDDPSAPLLLIKPGSYPWPPEIWQSFICP